MLESGSYAEVKNTGGGEIDMVLIAKSRHAAEVNGAEPAPVVGADAEDGQVSRQTDIGMVFLLIGLRAAVDIHTETEAGVEIDVGMEDPGEAKGRHEDKIVEILRIAGMEDRTRSVARDIIPAHFAHIHHRPQREPMAEPVLVFEPQMLVMAVVLLGGVGPSGRHGRHRVGGVMPHQTLE